MPIEPVYLTSARPQSLFRGFIARGSGVFQQPARLGLRRQTHHFRVAIYEPYGDMGC